MSDKARIQYLESLVQAYRKNDGVLGGPISFSKGLKGALDGIIYTVKQSRLVAILGQRGVKNA